MSRPWVSCNLAVSADGKISSPEHRPATWTSAHDHQRLLELRQNADALMVGRGTLETDRMTLTVPGRDPQPLRCMVSRHGDLSPDHPVFHRPGGAIHLLVTERPRVPAGLPLTVHHLDLPGFLDTLHKTQAVDHLHCEGGGQLIRALAEIDAIDELHLTLAGHTLLGGAHSPTLTGQPADFLPSSKAFSISHFESMPDTGECFLTYRRAHSASS